MLFKIMDLRAYARAKETYEQSVKNETDPMKRPTNAVIDKVRGITFELAKEKIQAKLGTK